MDPKIKILIVEDEEDTASEFAELFEGWGYEVKIAGDGYTALRLAQSFAPDAILLDIALPEMNGFTVTHALRNDPKYRSVLIIAVTAYGNTSYKNIAAKAGIDHYFVKPADMDKIKKLIEDTVSQNPTIQA